MLYRDSSNGKTILFGTRDALERVRKIQRVHVESKVHTFFLFGCSVSASNNSYPVLNLTKI